MKMNEMVSSKMMRDEVKLNVRVRMRMKVKMNGHWRRRKRRRWSMEIGEGDGYGDRGGTDTGHDGKRREFDERDHLGCHITSGKLIACLALVATASLDDEKMSRHRDGIRRRHTIRHDKQMYHLICSTTLVTNIDII